VREHEASPPRHRCWETAGEGFEGERLEGITAEDGRGLVKGPVARRPTTAEVVVVHRRQVIVHERVGVNHLHGHGSRGSSLPRSGFRQAVAASPSGPKDERWSESLAGREQGMPKRGNEPRGRIVGKPQRGFEERVYKMPHPPKPIGDGV